MNKLAYIIVTLALLCLPLYLFTKDSNTGYVSPVPLESNYTVIPVRLEIPKLNIKAEVEQVGMDSQKRMGVPKDADKVAWYQLGYKPGEKGSAVISGHLDRVGGSPAVFYKLSSLQKGDMVLVYGESQMLMFKVIEVQTYPYDQVPLQQVFNTKGKILLNLITCAGVYDTINQNYSERTVVYTEFVRDE